MWSRVESMGFGIRLFQFRPWLQYLTALGPRRIHLPSLCLSFFICKGEILASGGGIMVRNKTTKAWLEQSLTYNKCSINVSFYCYSSSLVQIIRLQLTYFVHINLKICYQGPFWQF